MGGEYDENDDMLAPPTGWIRIRYDSKLEELTIGGRTIWVNKTELKEAVDQARKIRSEDFISFRSLRHLHQSHIHHQDLLSFLLRLQLYRLANTFVSE